MLNTDISHFENRVDPDQLASQKPAELEPHCFHYILINIYMYFLILNWNPLSLLDKNC